MNIKTSYEDISSYITKDGSAIKELMHPEVNGNSAQSLAEATISAGNTTILHQHENTEEIYHILSGSGILSLDAKMLDVKEGDSVCILPGTTHNIKNTGEKDLRILCCCSPAYSHDDTEILE